MTQTTPTGAKAPFKPKFWQSTAYAFAAGFFYFVVAGGFGADDRTLFLYGAGVMAVIGFCAMQWRILTTVVWACVLVGIVATSGAGLFDWLSIAVLSTVMLAPFLGLDVPRFFAEKDTDTSPTRTWD